MTYKPAFFISNVLVEDHNLVVESSSIKLFLVRETTPFIMPLLLLCLHLTALHQYLHVYFLS